MTLTLLLDLDDTLLINGNETFLPAYFGGIARALSEFASPQEILSQFVGDPIGILSNTSPKQTIQELFRGKFYPNLGHSYEKLEPFLERYIDERHPDFESLVQRVPDASRLVEEAFSRGYRIGIATNPLYPRKATLQRLEWAGLPARQYPFELVSAYEDFHFTKPNPAYYAEVLTHMGWPEGPILMVGNDLDADIFGAKQLGLTAYWISDSQQKQLPPDAAAVPNGMGCLADVIPWIDKISPSSLIPRFDTRIAIAAVLRATPAALSIMTRDLKNNDWTYRPQPEDWSLTEILCHLRDIDREINLPRIEILCTGENSFIPAVDSDQWIHDRNYQLQSGPEALVEFVDSRIILLDRIEALNDEDWSQKCRHSILGPTTLQELLNISAQHDRKHIREIFQILKY